MIVIIIVIIDVVIVVIVAVVVIVVAVVVYITMIWQQAGSLLHTDACQRCSSVEIQTPWLLAPLPPVQSRDASQPTERYGLRRRSQTRRFSACATKFLQVWLNQLRGPWVDRGN